MRSLKIAQMYLYIYIYIYIYTYIYIYIYIFGICNIPTFRLSGFFFELLSSEFKVYET